MSALEKDQKKEMSNTYLSQRICPSTAHHSQLMWFLPHAASANLVPFFAPETSGLNLTGAFSDMASTPSTPKQELTLRPNNHAESPESESEGAAREMKKTSWRRRPRKDVRYRICVWNELGHWRGSDGYGVPSGRDSSQILGPSMIFSTETASYQVVSLK